MGTIATVTALLVNREMAPLALLVTAWVTACLRCCFVYKCFIIAEEKTAKEVKVWEDAQGHIC